MDEGRGDKQAGRLFIAIDIPANVRNQISNVMKRLQTGCRFVNCHPKWMSAEKLHVTLVFLGNITPAEIGVVSAVITDVAGSFEPFELVLNGLDFFPPDVKDPKVFSTGIGGDVKILKRLNAELSQRLSQSGIMVQDRPYRPHLTLARLTSIKTAARLAPLAESHSAMLNAKFPVNEIVLFESRPGPEGASYVEISKAGF